jgi:transposase
MKSEDLQKVVLRLHQQGLSSRQISNQLADEICKSTINKRVKMYRESGEIDLKKPPGGKRSKRTK